MGYTSLAFVYPCNVALLYSCIPLSYQTRAASEEVKTESPASCHLTLSLDQDQMAARWHEARDSLKKGMLIRLKCVYWFQVQMEKNMRGTSARWAVTLFCSELQTIILEISSSYCCYMEYQDCFSGLITFMFSPKVHFNSLFQGEWWERRSPYWSLWACKSCWRIGSWGDTAKLHWLRWYMFLLNLTHIYPTLQFVLEWVWRWSIT